MPKLTVKYKITSKAGEESITSMVYTMGFNHDERFVDDDDMRNVKPFLDFLRLSESSNLRDKVGLFLIS